MEEQKLDILISPDISDPFVRLAKEYLVLLMTDMWNELLN